jgi:hypothetical protein
MMDIRIGLIERVIMKRNSNNNLDDFKDEYDIVGDDDFKHKIVGSVA